ncbi:MAG TPA: hypothetical protein DCL53_03205 [Thauera sp.]|nr:hypothetical protein [Thauera sp.]
MNESLSRFARPQVRSTLRQGDRLFLATEIGLFELVDGALAPIEAWRGQPVQHITEAPDGYILMIEDSGQSLHRCDGAWNPVGDLPCVPREKIKTLCMTPSGLLAGTKSGLFRLEGERWERLFADAHGRGEILWVRSADGRHIRASVKKMGPYELPALIESLDGGETWSVEASDDYQDYVHAADGQWIVTRWKGARRRGERGEYKKHPLSTGRILDDGWAVLDGDKLETQRAGHAAPSFYHPVMAEAEQLQVLGDRALVAGVQGAFLMDPAHGSATDLFAAMPLPAGLGKLKRLFALDDGVLFATATFGSFRSADGGQTWAPVDSEWTVLDAEAVARSADGRWWLACQRALFVSVDNGASWRYVKLKVKQHHYAELRGGVAVANGRVYVGTKTGLLASTLADPEAVNYVPAFAHQAIEALHGGADEGELIVGTGEGALWRYDAVREAATPIASAPVLESTVVGAAGHFLLATGERVFEIADGASRELTPAQDEGDYALSPAGAERFVLWNDRRAWLGRPGGALTPLPGWPQGVRHACLCEGGGALLTTDRREIRRVALPGAEA